MNNLYLILSHHPKFSFFSLSHFSSFCRLLVLKCSCFYSEWCCVVISAVGTLAVIVHMYKGLACVQITFLLCQLLDNVKAFTLNLTTLQKPFGLFTFCN